MAKCVIALALLAMFALSDAQIVEEYSMMPSAAGTAALRRLLNDHMQAANYEKYYDRQPCSGCDGNGVRGGLGLDLGLGLKVDQSLKLATKAVDSTVYVAGNTVNTALGVAGSTVGKTAKAATNAVNNAVNATAATTAVTVGTVGQTATKVVGTASKAGTNLVGGLVAGVGQGVSGVLNTVGQTSKSLNLGTSVAVDASVGADSKSQGTGNLVGSVVKTVGGLTGRLLGGSGLLG